jgi:signal transduction histidine kinase
VWASALAVGAFAVVGTFGASDNQPDRASVDALAIALVLIGPLALAWRDRWPLVAVAVTMAAADLYVGLGYAYGPIFLAVVVALFAAVQAGRRRETWALAALGYAGFVVAAALDDHADDPVDLAHLGLVAGWLIVVLAVSEVVRSRREQTAQQARAAEDERERLRAEQRLDLAQELHDVLAHNISLINVQASVALHLLDDEPERARPALTEIKAASGEALHELRTALDVLRRGEEAPRAPAPRLTDVDELVAGVRSSGLDVHLSREDHLPGVPAAVELAAYRIVQEALTNVARHAAATAVDVRIASDPSGGGLEVEVIDNGTGGEGGEDARPVNPGNGIVGMRERAAALGGTVETGPAPTGTGFRVLARLPAGPP